METVEQAEGYHSADSAYDVVTEIPEDVTEQVNNEVKNYFINMIKNARTNEGQALRDQIEQRQADARTYESRMRDVRWQLNDLNESLRVHEQIAKNRADTFEAEFDALLRHAKVAGIAIEDECVYIKTTELKMTDPESGGQTVLGEMEIKLPVTSDRLSRLTIINRTNAKADGGGTVWDHPHVEAHRPCFGSFEDQIISALAASNIGEAFEKVLMYLQTFNPDDSYGRHSEYWDWS